MLEELGWMGREVLLVEDLAEEIWSKRRIFAEIGRFGRAIPTAAPRLQRGGSEDHDGDGIWHQGTRAGRLTLGPTGSLRRHAHQR